MSAIGGKRTFGPRIPACVNLRQCTGNPEAAEPFAKTVGKSRGTLHIALALAGALLCSCAPDSTATSAAQRTANSILVSSAPAGGSTVAAPVNELVLNFDPPARLGEVTVTGPDGMMPTMVTSVGEVARYTIPLHGLGPGSYTVRWTATVAGQAHEGSFGFTVR